MIFHCIHILCIHAATKKWDNPAVQCNLDKTEGHHIKIKDKKGYRQIFYLCNTKKQSKGIYSNEQWKILGLGLSNRAYEAAGRGWGKMQARNDRG